ncbi:MAG: single-stranded-DNA-specific exonuclease RecJ [Desulfobacteraceae bacterium]|jgi:single-stranded-DNA-specific exonuclease|nr:single-stranded-DNA-specific exonuclease RecJ [Desulfobacteraceae bacterium]
MHWEWNLTQPDPECLDRLCSELACSKVMATLLSKRGMSDPSQADRFLHSRLEDLRPPFGIRDMDRAVRRLRKALQDGEHILIYGDYDADGITATVLLVDLLREIGARVSFAIPHRIHDGYGLKPSLIRSHAAAEGIGLIITVDCGSSDHEAIEAARLAGIDVIVTDHHIPSEPFPRAVAFVNPNRRDCTSGMGHLAGVGVAFYLAAALRAHLREAGFHMGPAEPNLKKRCDLVALGTVADMVPMVAENRILVRAGLQQIQAGHRPGVRTLMERASVSPDTVDETDIAFRLAPRLNATGRMDHASKAVDLLLGMDLPTARSAADRIESLNQRRKAAEQEVFDQILLRLEKSPEERNRASLVLSNPSWHEGVLGIAASRLVHRFHRPVVLIRSQNGVGRGSARGIPGMDLYGLMRACSDHLVRFGGHAAAAGLSIDCDAIEGFREAFERHAREHIAGPDFRMTLDIDAAVPLNEITPSLLDELERLKPYGQGNPEPLFVASDVRVLSSEVVGEKHRRLVLVQAGGDTGRRHTAMQFNADVERAPPEHFRELVFRAGWNVWRGVRSPRIVVVDARNTS